MQLELISRQPEANVRPIPLLFVHGAWHSAWCWDEHFLPYFTRHGYACHALSLRGHGASEGRSRLRWARIADYAADVAQVAVQLPTPPVLIGHSMGGLVVQKYLETRSAPAAVLLASVPPGGVLRITLQIARQHTFVFLRANLTMSLFPIIGSPALAREAFFSTEALAQTYFARLQDESYLAFLDMLALNLPRPARVKTPLLVLGAADDTIFSVAEVQATARAYSTQAEIFPDMAHDMMLESGWQPVADRILAWLKERGLSSTDETD
jgi:pimeloyl-ACP methyl ester carboxylesterase